MLHCERVIPLNVKKIPMGSYIPCTVHMSSKKMKKTRSKFSCACPNWAAVLVEGTPYCAAHAPLHTRELYP